MYEYHDISDIHTDAETGCMMSVITLVTIAFVILMTLVFGSCSRQVTAVVERVRTDTLLITNTQRDSIFIHDSVSTYQQQAGDTLYIYRDRWRTEYRDKTVHDTLYSSRTDSIPAPYPVIKEVNHLYWWQKTLAWTGAIAILLVIIGLFWRMAH